MRARPTRSTRSSPTPTRATLPEEPRLATGFVVAALVRRLEAAGGGAMVLARGDAVAGALLVQLTERGVPGDLVERRLGSAGYEWAATGPADPAEVADYLARRRRSDPDLWVVELDHADALAILRAVAI